MLDLSILAGQGDPRQPHHSGVDLPASHLTALGVQYHPSSHTSPSIVDDLASAKAFSHRDEITYSPAAMGAAYEDQVAMNFHEHIHDEDEIRYITQGSGYFDVRDADDSKWARIKVDRGDCIVLPRGIYHRFMVDENNVRVTHTHTHANAAWGSNYPLLHP